MSAICEITHGNCTTYILHFSYMSLFANIFWAKANTVLMAQSPYSLVVASYNLFLSTGKKGNMKRQVM